jgi:hypothetical protein
VRLEFARMAATADAYIASQKEKKISGWHGEVKMVGELWWLPYLTH